LAMDEKKKFGEHLIGDYRPKSPNLVLAKICTKKVVKSP